MTRYNFGPKLCVKCNGEYHPDDMHTDTLCEDCYITYGSSAMRCNNCGCRMFRSCVNFNITVCNECGMKHIWPNPPNAPHQARRDSDVALNAVVGNGLEEK